MSLLLSALAILCAAGGVALLHRAWRRRGGASLVLRGWLMIAVAVAPWRATGAAWDKAAAFAATTPLLIAFGVLIWEAEVHPSKKKPRTVKPVAPAVLPTRSDALWRGLLRTALAGPVAGAAALGLTALVAIHAPWNAADRLVAAGFVLPLVWAGAGVWATTDGRLARVGAGLVAMALIGFGAASL